MGARLLLVGAALASNACPRSEPTPRSVDASSGDPEAEPQSPTLEPTAFRERAKERQTLVERLKSEGIRDSRVLEAMLRVPRHAFVPESASSQAYLNRPLPIGYGQTISQPYIVAAMTEAVAPQRGDKCLEVGTGSGYQAAVLAELCQRVYSVEYLPEVAQSGKANLRRLGYGANRVQLRVGDGYRGWPEAQPFQVIVVTAAPERVPPPLLEQLDVGGRLVIPVGTRLQSQRLELWKRVAKGKASFEKRTLMSVMFVPFLGEGQAP